jgi:surfactin synthase thioesterase subunit
MKGKGTLTNMELIVTGVQQYQSSLLDNLRKQMEAVLKKHSGSTSGQLEKDAMDIFATTFRQDSVIKKQFSCLDAEEIPIAGTTCGGSKDIFIKDK